MRQVERQNDLATNSSEATVKRCGVKHLGMMLICCLVPLVVALTLKMFGYAGVASYLVLLLCPLMHLFMMKDMFTNRVSCSDKKQHSIRWVNDMDSLVIQAYEKANPKQLSHITTALEGLLRKRYSSLDPRFNVTTRQVEEVLKSQGLDYTIR